MVDLISDLLTKVSKKLEQNPTRTPKSDLELYWAACRELQGTYISPGSTPTPPGEVLTGSQYVGETSSLQQQVPNEQNIYGGSYIIGSLPFPVDIAPSTDIKTSTPIITTSAVPSRKRDYLQVDEVGAKQVDDAESEHQHKRSRYLLSVQDSAAPQTKTRLFSIKKSQRKNNTQQQQQSYRQRQNSSTLLPLAQSHSHSHSHSQLHLQHDSFDSSFHSMFPYKTQLIRSRSHSYVQHSQHQQEDFSTRYSLRRRHSISSDEDTDLRSKYDLFRKTNSKKAEQRKQSQKGQSQNQGRRVGGMGAVMIKKKQSQNEKLGVAGPRGVEKKQGRYNLRVTRARVNASVVGW